MFIFGLLKDTGHILHYNLHNTKMFCFIVKSVEMLWTLAKKCELVIFWKISWTYMYLCLGSKRLLSEDDLNYFAPKLIGDSPGDATIISYCKFAEVMFASFLYSDCIIFSGFQVIGRSYVGQEIFILGMVFMYGYADQTKVVHILG